MWKRRSIETLVGKVDEMEQVFRKRDSGRLRKNWWNTLRCNISYKGHRDDKAVHRNDWQTKIHAVNPT